MIKNNEGKMSTQRVRNKSRQLAAATADSQDGRFVHEDKQTYDTSTFHSDNLTAVAFIVSMVAKVNRRVAERLQSTYDILFATTSFPGVLTSTALKLIQHQQQQHL